MWITLTGFMASGKSTVARHLGPAQNLPIVSLDELAAERSGCSIGDFFDRNGEAAFRELELEMLEGLDPGSDLIVDAGGGLVETPAAVDLIRQRGVVLWLDAPWEAVQGRLQGGGTPDRPLARDMDWTSLEALYNRRQALYARAADFRLAGASSAAEDLARLAVLRCRAWANREAENRS